MRIRALIIAGSIATLLAGCGFFAREPDIDPGPSGGSIILTGAVPGAVRNRTPLPSCGVENATTQSGPWNAAGRQCFAAAYVQGQPAEFVSTRLTIEGDPIRTVFRILGPGRVEVLVDSTRDAYSNRTWSRSSCALITIDATHQPSPDFGFGEDCASEEIR